MARYVTEDMPDKFHKAIEDWQQRHFPEVKLLKENWSDHFKGVRPFELTAKIGTDISGVINVGRFAGQERFEEAEQMDDEMFAKALAIIKAQCSTEFGSVQQHQMSLDHFTTEAAQFAIMRIMAEELRHAYQMVWVLAADTTWEDRSKGVARDLIDELLSMEHGDHVLDAFNVDFDTFLDNCVFAAIIDMVGKYQLDMQRAFSYAPVARSMVPMYMEEGFHLGAGKRFTGDIVASAALGEGDFSLEDIQRTFNKWVPRGLEMFGHEKGGKSNISFGFKTKTNAQAQGEYRDEVADLVRDINARIVRARNPKLTGSKARAAVDDMLGRQSDALGVAFEELIQMPDRCFFRWRGDGSNEPIDTLGNALTQDGKPMSPEGYVRYLRTVLPAPFFKSSPFLRYEARLNTPPL